MTRMSSCFFLLPLHFCYDWNVKLLLSVTFALFVSLNSNCYDWNVKLLLSVTIAWFVSLNTELL